jgi:hypothetical protein|tara:strand:+ start:40 stop:291 length:252 start_codon:yes stop_codon:yes gene_type:complete
MRTRKINQKGFDYYLEINGKDIDAIADVWTGGEYIGQLEKAHIYRGITVTWQAKGSGTSIGKQSLLDACRQLHHQFRKEKVHG